MSTNEKILQAGVGVALIIFGTPNMKLAGAALIIGAMTPDEKPPEIANLQIGSQVSGTDPVGARRIVYGQTRVGGVITYSALRGEKNQYLNLVYTLAGHEIEEVSALYLNDELVPLNGGGDATGKFAGYVHAEYRLGTADQTVLTGLKNSSYPTWLGGSYKGLRLDGMGNYAAAAGTTAFNLATMTFELWVRPLAYQPGCIAALGGGQGWALRYLEDGRIRLTDGAGLQTTVAAQAPSNWVHVAFTGSGSATQIYLNGDLVATGGAFTNGASGSMVLTIGSLDGVSEFLCSDVDDLQIWNTVRSESQIETDGTRGNLGAAASNRLTAIPFDEGSGTTADDNESPEHDLTLHPSWTDDHRQRGCAYAWVRLRTNETLFPSGLPNITFDLKGKLVREPRTSPPTTAWSNNAALIQADYLTDADFGLGIDSADVDDDLLAAAANLADEDVELNDGASPPGTEKRYTIDGSFTTEMAPHDILTQMFAASQGYLSLVGGVWGIYGGAYRTPTVTLTEADLRDEPDIDTILPTRENFNAVKGVFPDPAHNYQPGELPPVTNAAYEAEDGGERKYLDTSFPLTTSAARAQRLAKIILERTRQGITLRWPGRLGCFRNQPGDVVLVTWTVLGFAAKPFEVVEGQFVSYGEPPALGYDLLLRETASTVYDWSQEETTVDPAPNSFLPNPFVVLPPENLALESGTPVLGIRLDGTVFSRIRASWEAPADEFVTAGGRIQVQYRLSGQSPEADWLPHEYLEGSQTESFILDVIDGSIYDVRIRSVNAAGAVSPWATVTGHTVIGKTEPPSDVSGFSVQQNGDKCIFRWDQVPDLDLAGYETRFAAVGVAWEDANRVTRVTRGTKVTDGAIPPGPQAEGGERQPWRFHIKAIDTTGNESVTATTFDLVVDAQYDAIFQNEQWPIWGGTKVNMVRNPLTGNLRLRSQTLAADLDDESLWGEAVPDPYPEGSYTAPEIDTGGDDKVRIWAEDAGFMAPGETGVPNASLEVDTRLAAGSYDGYEPWTIGEATARYVTQRISVLAADGVEILTGFKAIVDLLEHSEEGTASIPVGGTTVAFARSYRLPPQVTINSATDGGSPPTTRFAQFTAVTPTDFWCAVVDNTGDVGGQIEFETLGT